MFKAGVNVSIIVSARIVSYTDWRLAQDCYSSLYNGGMKGRIRKALTKFTFAHQKYWIIDGKSVHLSTGMQRRSSAHNNQSVTGHFRHLSGQFFTLSDQTNTGIYLRNVL